MRDLATVTTDNTSVDWVQSTTHSVYMYFYVPYGRWRMVNIDWHYKYLCET